MRIVINGQQAFGKACLEAILKEGKDDVVAVYTAPDVDGKPIDPIKQSALDAGLEVRQPANFESPEILEELRSWNADLMLLAYVIIFVPEQARNIPKMVRYVFIHRCFLCIVDRVQLTGPSYGAKQTGLTIFWPDDGLDEGDILLQKQIDILPDDTLGTLYFDKIFPAGVSATLEAIDLIRSGKLQKYRRMRQRQRTRVGADARMLK